MQKGKVEEAKKVFVAIEKFDGTPVKSCLDDVELEEFLEKEHEKMTSESSEKSGKKYSFLSLFETREIFTGTFVIAFTL